MVSCLHYVCLQYLVMQIIHYFLINDKYVWCRSLFEILSRSEMPLHCIMIVLVELRCTDCTNKWSSLFETTYIYEHFNELTFVKLLLLIKLLLLLLLLLLIIIIIIHCNQWYNDTIIWILKYLNEYRSNKFQGRLSN